MMSNTDRRNARVPSALLTVTWVLAAIPMVYGCLMAASSISNRSAILSYQNATIFVWMTAMPLWIMICAPRRVATRRIVRSVALANGIAFTIGSAAYLICREISIIYSDIVVLLAGGLFTVSWMVLIPVLLRKEARKVAAANIPIPIVCPQCGYDVDDLKTTTCPECGNQMTLGQWVACGDRER